MTITHDWNSLTPVVVNSKSLTAFKCSLDKLWLHKRFSVQEF